jgi:hypothetical protein
VLVQEYTARRVVVAAQSQQLLVVAVVAVAQRRRQLMADGAVGLIALPSPSQHRGARHGSTWLDMAWTRLRSAPRSLPTRGCQASGPVACGSAARQSPKAHLAYPTSPPYTTTGASPDRPRSSRCGERAACSEKRPVCSICCLEQQPLPGRRQPRMLARPYGYKAYLRPSQAAVLRPCQSVSISPGLAF